MKGFFSELHSSRPLQVALFASLTWHLIWLFAMFIDLRDPVRKPKLEPKIYFVGPILSDDAFNMILATKPEFSTTTYRSEPIAPQSMEPRPQAMDRPEPGDLVSVPLGQSTWASLRGHLKDDKPYPRTLFQKKFSVEIVPKPFPVEGELEHREMLAVPELPALPARVDAPWIDPEFELTVSADGVVREVRQTIASGDLETDRVLERYLKQWQFMPSDETRGSRLETGKVRVTEPRKRA